MFEIQKQKAVGKLILVFIIWVSLFFSLEPISASERLGVTLEQFIISGGSVWENVDIQDKNGDTFLHLAVKQRTILGVYNLLISGADPHLKNDKGESPFDLAVEYAQKRYTPPIPSLTIPSAYYSYYGMDPIEKEFKKLENRIGELERENKALREEMKNQQWEMEYKIGQHQSETILVLMKIFGY